MKSVTYALGGHRWTAWLIGLLSIGGILALVFSGADAGDAETEAVVTRGDVSVTLTETGTLRPAQSVTYRSALLGREAEVTFLAPEGSYVNVDDVVVRLDTTEIERELVRTIDLARQADLSASVATVARADAAAEVTSVTEGSRALEVEEAQVRLDLAERNVLRLREEHAGLATLLAKGFITRDELNRSSQELEVAEAEIGLMRKRSGLLSETDQPREEQRARLQLVQSDAQLANVQQQAREMRGQVDALRAALEAAEIRTRAAGLVVYEEFTGAVPRRKVRVGDRVTAAQGLVTIPEVERMLVETSVRESDLWRLAADQSANIAVDAFPALKLTGRVTSIGTMAMASSQAFGDEKRFGVTIAVDGASRQLRPDMTARAHITVAAKRGVLTIPPAAIARINDQWVVRVRGRLTTEDRVVTIGEAAPDKVEVISGLAEGERVLLGARPPS